MEGAGLMKYVGKIQLINLDFVKKERKSTKDWLFFFLNSIYELSLLGIILFLALLQALWMTPNEGCMDSTFTFSCWEYGKYPIRVLITLILFAIFTLILTLLRTAITSIVHYIDRSTKNKIAADQKRFRVQVEQEAQKLAKIRASMTEAEWAAYEIQLENKRLLEEIKNKQDNSKGSGPGFFYGISN
jgi:hypothetical protein